MRAGLIHLLSGLGRRRRVIAAALVLTGGIAVAAASHGQTSVGVLKVRVGGDSHQTRMVIELDRPTKGTLLSGPGAPCGQGEPGPGPSRRPPATCRATAPAW